ncbi:hypothetical protein DUI87_15581 [Hirundo rustica rustica]|uniref:Uncharacterized protein n=1 Tax=Hirundo rustica rustica TaxID=333673 RepID=A0A3M0K1F2_HIRRU|nr:hypothetical protein DUI87_15581 [Hirundo rustica rustica]
MNQFSQVSLEVWVDPNPKQAHLLVCWEQMMWGFDFQWEQPMGEKTSRCLGICSTYGPEIIPGDLYLSVKQVIPPPEMFAIYSDFNSETPPELPQHREDVELLERAQRRQQDEQRDGAALLGAKAGRAGIVQPGREKLWAELRVALQGLKEVTRKMEREYLPGVE